MTDSGKKIDHSSSILQSDIDNILKQLGLVQKTEQMQIADALNAAPDSANVFSPKMIELANGFLSTTCKIIRMEYAREKITTDPEYAASHQEIVDSVDAYFASRKDSDHMMDTIQAEACFVDMGKKLEEMQMPLPEKTDQEEYESMDLPEWREAKARANVFFQKLLVNKKDLLPSDIPLEDVEGFILSSIIY
jgi:hypothetical protein